jgi:hippurate hydrolase
VQTFRFVSGHAPHLIGSNSRAPHLDLSHQAGNAGSCLADQLQDGATLSQSRLGEASVSIPAVTLVNDPAETAVVADVAADLVGEANVNRNRSLITAAEDFAYMLEARPGAFINIGIAGIVGGCPVRSPRYDFNDAALPIGASLFARLVEKKLPRLSGD